MSVEGKVVLVTGAASGIGRALAVGFAKDNSHVIGFDIDTVRINEVCGNYASNTIAVTGDVSSESDVDRLVALALQHYGRIDVLINNAGIAASGSLLDSPFETWARVIRVNLIGVALCTHRILPLMLKQGYGRIINVVSRAAESPNNRQSAYGASKAGVITFTKATANAIDRNKYPDVLVNALIPGVTRTAIWDNAIKAGLLGQETISSYQEPEAVYPHTRFVVELPRGGPTGRVFFNSIDYPVYSNFNRLM